MNNLSRRSLLKGMGAVSLSGFNVMSRATTAHAQDSIFRFSPDAQATLSGKPIRIDLALLGVNGEETAGFYASLDPIHGKPFEKGWLNFYGPWLMNDPENFNAWKPRPLTDSEARNTSREKIDHIITHLTTHGLQFEKDLKPLYDMALDAWNAHPNLRLNDHSHLRARHSSIS